MKNLLRFPFETNDVYTFGPPKTILKKMKVFFQNPYRNIWQTYPPAKDEGFQHVVGELIDGFFGMILPVTGFNIEVYFPPRCFFSIEGHD